MTLRSKLAEIRHEHGMTQDQIVALVKPTFEERDLVVTQGLWSAWESGQRPEDSKIAALEDALGLEPGELFSCLRDTALGACIAWLLRPVFELFPSPA